MGDKNFGNCNPCCNPCLDTSDSVCIHTRKIYDSCRDKECIENIRVYLTECGQNIVDKSINIKCRNSEIIWVYSDVEPVPFNRGYYTVDLKFFFKITLDVFTGVNRPTVVEGLATFDKKVILFGSEGNAKTFMSKYKFDEADVQLWSRNNLPVAHTDVFDSIAIGVRIVRQWLTNFSSTILCYNCIICLTFM